MHRLLSALCMSLVLFFASRSSTEVGVYAHSAQVYLRDLEQDQDRPNVEYLGWTGAEWSHNLKHVVIGVGRYPANTNRGKLIVMTESSPGAQDWGATNDTQQNLLDTDWVFGDVERLGLSGGRFSSNDEHVMTNSQDWNDRQGKCIVFSESTPGSEDWKNNHYSIVDKNYDPAALNYLGPCTWANQDDSAILACSFQDNSGDGKCVVFLESSPGAKDWADRQVDLYNGVTAGSGWMSRNGAKWSYDDRHIMAGSISWDEGKLVMFSESVVGARDWNVTTQEIFDTSYVSGESSVGVFGEISFSSDAQHLAACGYEYNSDQGKCIVYSESAPGSADWQDIQENIYDVNSVSGDKFGFGGAAFSPVDTNVVACSAWANTYRGRCVVFSESGPGNRDWNSQQAVLYDPDAEELDYFGLNGAKFSPDGRYICTCAKGRNNEQGICYLFVESFIGAQDWETNFTTLWVESGKAGDWLGNYAASYTLDFSPDSKLLMTCSTSWNYASGQCIVFNPDFRDQCYSAPCQHGGNCTDLAFDYSCACPNGTTGKSCETDIDECGSSPCLNGATCTDDGTELYAYNCTCVLGYTGVICDEDVDDCASNPCAVNGTCIDDGAIANQFECSCDLGYNGTLCDEDVDDCASNPCMFGICLDDGVIANHFECTCAAGYNGTLCDTDINDCASGPCGNNGTCSDDGSIPQAFNCTCEPGFNGTLCDGDINDCGSNPCDPVGALSCTDVGTDNFQCTCREYYTGETCAIPPPCLSNPCENGGTCTDLTFFSLLGGTPEFECNCVTGTTGVFCDTDVNDCTVDSCHSRGTDRCVDTGLNAFMCECLTGWTGERCTLSEERTFTIQYVLSATSNASDVAKTLELDLEDEYVGIQISVSIVMGNDSDFLSFEIVFLDTNDTTFILPDTEDLALFVDNQDYGGSLVGVNPSGTSTPLAETEPQNNSNVTLLLIAAGLLMAIFCVGGIACYAFRRKPKQNYRVPD